jgi:hypothetical protein
MRWGFLTLTMLAVAGCSWESHPPTTQPAAVIETVYEPALASALAFTPPIAQNEPPLDLARDLRRPGAFVGFDEVTRNFTYVRTDDRFSADGTDRFERHAIIEKVGSSSR